MSTVDLLLGGAALALVLALVSYYYLAILQSRHAKEPVTDRAGSGAQSVPHPSAASRSRVSATRPGTSSPAVPPDFGNRGGSSPKTGDPQSADPAARGTWDLYAHSSAHWREPATYRVRSTGQGAPRWNPFAEEQSRAHRARARRHRPPSLPRIADHYALLGLDRDATLEEIERAYRRHAAQIHPDRFFEDPIRRAEAEKKLKQLNAVMEILRDPIRRAKYDARLSRRQAGPMGEE